ncbi:protein asteroid homolog 1-like [Anarrhichthys ocellatus]|uniref:protein asteroid homolog 1-like n=1 Tax=Anarrhichthys ocellatus TaxID=433405 RepID=UPI0012ECFCEA|nr:protein asteroid homolog 1-like [Anarrhichthys ocellatus]
MKIVRTSSTTFKWCVCVCVAALQIQNHQRRQKLDLVLSHSFNQWQACLEVGIQLNQLLGFPLPEPQISRLCEGTVVHQLVHSMQSGGKLWPFLGNDHTSVKLFQTFRAVVQKKASLLDDLTADLQQRLLLN